MKSLIEAVKLRKQIENQIKAIKEPLTKQLASALGALPGLYSKAKALETQERAHWEAAHIQAFNQRQALLRQGVECPPIPLPEGISEAFVDAIAGKATPENAARLLELGVLKVDDAALGKLLKAGTEVPGFTLGKRISLRVKV